jgi:hypothetical protein
MALQQGVALPAGCAHRTARAAHKLEEPPVSRRLFLAEASFDLGFSLSLALPNGSRPPVKLFVRRATLPMLTGAVLCTAAMPAPTALHQAFAILLEAADTAVLRRVVDLLLENAEPERRAVVLRTMIAELLDTSADVSKPTAKRPAAAQRRPAPPRPAKRAEDPHSRPGLSFARACARSLNEVLPKKRSPPPSALPRRHCAAPSAGQKTSRAPALSPAPRRGSPHTRPMFHQEQPRTNRRIAYRPNSASGWPFWRNTINPSFGVRRM